MSSVVCWLMERSKLRMFSGGGEIYAMDACASKMRDVCAECAASAARQAALAACKREKAKDDIMALFG